MKKICKLMSILLCAALCLGLFPAGVASAEATGTETAAAVQPEPVVIRPEPGEEARISLTFVNPLYEGLISAEDLNKAPETGDAEIAAVNAQEYSADEDQLVRQFRAAFKQRSETIQLKYQMSGSATGDEIKAQASVFCQKAVAHTGVPTEGDYLLLQYGGYQCSMSYSKDGSYCYVTYTYTMTYYTTAEQESEMDAAAAAVISDLSLDGKTSYEKLSAIYDYICDNVTYDYANLNDSSYMLKYTAYAALINKTAVCQGYTVLFYRLALMAGVDARAIRGTGNGGGHAWNIARIGSLYYNLDSTWDAGRSVYSYFLRCEANFGDHTRDGQYTTAEFNSAYPMSPVDYDPGSEPVYPVSGVCGADLSWTLDAEGTLTISGAGSMEDYTSGSAPWYDYRENISALAIGSGVTGIGCCAFSGCTALTEVVFPGDAPVLGEDCFSGVTAEAFYPAGNETWTAEIMQNYGGSITWTAVYIGYALSGTAVSWDGNSNELVCLYSGMTEDEIKADISAGAAGAVYTAQCGEAVQNADGQRYDVAFSFSAVEAGEYILAICKPGNYVLKTLAVTVSGDADLGELCLQLAGDIGGDGKVNTMDLIRLMKYLNGVETEVTAGSADVNGDGKENTMDLIRLMKLINGETA